MYVQGVAQPRHQSESVYFSSEVTGSGIARIYHTLSSSESRPLGPSLVCRHSLCKTSCFISFRTLISRFHQTSPVSRLFQMMCISTRGSLAHTQQIRILGMSGCGKGRSVFSPSLVVTVLSSFLMSQQGCKILCDSIQDMIFLSPVLKVVPHVHGTLVSTLS